MKKLFLSLCFITSAIYGNSQECSAKIDNFKMSFYSNSIVTPLEPVMPNAIEITIRIRLWERGHKASTACDCVHIGVGCKPCSVNPGGNGDGAGAEGRDVYFVSSLEALQQMPSLTVYVREDISDLTGQDLNFNVAEDFQIAGNVYVQQGSFAFNPAIGQFGGYVIPLIIK